MTREDEQAIIERVLNGHTAEFEALVIAHQKGVYNLALRLSGNEQDALDLSQEAFIKAFRFLRNFRGDSKFSVWLYRLTTNVCIDFLRKKKRLTAASLTISDDVDEEYEIPDSRFEPQNVLETLETQKAVAEGLRALPEDYRSILTLREVNGLSYEDIGDVLRLEAGTVKSRLFRARKRLASWLIASGNFTPGESSNPTKGGVMDD